METEVKLTKLASCAGCGAKVGAGTLVRLLEGFQTHSDPRLIVGYDKSDDACVYVIDGDTALVQTTDFFPPIVDDPYLFGQIAAANALSDAYAMGGEPKLALNILCLADRMDRDTVQGSSLPGDIPSRGQSLFMGWQSPALSTRTKSSPTLPPVRGMC